jgi:hypothetical protein
LVRSVPIPKETPMLFLASQFFSILFNFNCEKFYNTLLHRKFIKIIIKH